MLEASDAWDRMIVQGFGALKATLVLRLWHLNLGNRLLLPRPMPSAANRALP